jgi:hypothetical protein
MGASSLEDKATGPAAALLRWFSVERLALSRAQLGAVRPLAIFTFAMIPTECGVGDLKARYLSVPTPAYVRVMTVELRLSEEQAWMGPLLWVADRI